jgi:hypothetical protein
LISSSQTPSHRLNSHHHLSSEIAVCILSIASKVPRVHAKFWRYNFRKISLRKNILNHAICRLTCITDKRNSSALRSMWVISHQLMVSS